MLRHVALVITDVSEEFSSSNNRVTIMGATDARYEFHSSLILVTLMMEAQSSSETSVLTRATQCNMSEDDILLRLFACLFGGV
jgi:hypothetical protein